jgi:hypothetical protein
VTVNATHTRSISRYHHEQHTSAGPYAASINDNRECWPNAGFSDDNYYRHGVHSTNWFYIGESFAADNSNRCGLAYQSSRPGGRQGNRNRGRDSHPTDPISFVDIGCDHRPNIFCTALPFG